MRRKNNVTKFLIINLFLFVVSSTLVYGFKIKNDMLTDDGGRHIKITNPYNRIISLYPAHTENLCALHGYKYIVGISISDTYPPYILKKPKFSYHFGVERFLVVKPDLVLIRPMIEFGYPNLIKKFKKENIAVISIQPNNISSLYSYWMALGLIIGKRENAQQIIADFKDTIEFFHSINKKIKHKKMVFFESIHRKFKTFAPDSIPMFVLKSAGGINIAQDAYEVRNSNIADYGKEKILSHASEIDVFLAQRGRMNRIRIKDIKKEPGFNIIKAVKNNEIHLVAEEVTSRPTIRLLMGIYEIGHILYPTYYDNRVKQRIQNILKKYYQK
ncbi:ABC transporter substrate-binding protein [Desulfothermus sp.]